MQSRTLIVISDLHLGGGDALDDCDRELEDHLVDFLGELSRRQAPVELIINGDFLDFAQAPPWRGKELESATAGNVPLCFSEKQSSTKFSNIGSAHARVFTALGGFLSGGGGNRLVVLPGNHDADFFWPEVRRLFKERVSKDHPGTERHVSFHLDQVYRPAAFPGAWIEHGHQYDPINNFFIDGRACWSEAAPPIRDDSTGLPRLYECIGTRFLIRFMNQLDSYYPLVDNIKPFGRFLNIFGASLATPGFWPLKAAVATWAMLRYLSRTLHGRRGDLLSDEVGSQNEGEVEPASFLAGLTARLDETQRRAFVAAINERGFAIKGDFAYFVSDERNAEALMTFLSENLDLLDAFEEADHASYLSMDGDSGYLALREAYDIKETEELKDHARDILRRDRPEVVVMGHTHERVNPIPDFPYINIGSWTRYYVFGDDEKTNAHRLLRTRSYEKFPYQLNYAEIVPDRPQPARLETFKGRQA